MKLLIVDDSRITRLNIERRLNIEGVTTVLHAQDGAAALAIFSEELPDFVSLDLTLPKIGGMDCIEAMLEMRPDTKIVIISALNDKFITGQVLAKGAHGYLNKPFSTEQLNQAFSVNASIQQAISLVATN